MNLPSTAATLGTLGLGAGLAALMAGWQQVRGFITRIAGILVMSSEYRGFGAVAARMFCQRALRTTPSALRLYYGKIMFVRPLARQTVVFSELLNGTRLFWVGWKPILVTDNSQTNDGKPGREDALTFRFLRGTFDPDVLALEIAKQADIRTEEGSRFRVERLSGRSGKARVARNEESARAASPNSEPTQLQRDSATRLVGWKDSDIGEAEPPSDPLERLALTPEVLEAVAEVERWANSKDWYTERQIAWRRGLNLYGRPGTGKSSLIKAMAQKMKLPIYLLDISTMDNEEFHEAYQTALYHRPAIVLIEDIDAVFDGRENVAAEKGKGLTFDCLLNTVSGVESSDGILLVVTTNHIDKVDAALGVPQPGSLSTRPGRIDRAVEMPALTIEGREKLARRILASCDESWINHMVYEGMNDTGAQFEDRCGQVALALYWSQNPKQLAPNPLAEQEAA